MFLDKLEKGMEIWIGIRSGLVFWPGQLGAFFVPMPGLNWTQPTFTVIMSTLRGF